jgi:hypothetical protein
MRTTRPLTGPIQSQNLNTSRNTHHLPLIKMTSKGTTSELDHQTKRLSNRADALEEDKFMPDTPRSSVRNPYQTPRTRRHHPHGKSSGQNQDSVLPVSRQSAHARHIQSTNMQQKPDCASHVVPDPDGKQGNLSSHGQAHLRQCDILEQTQDFEGNRRVRGGVRSASNRPYNPSIHPRQQVQHQEQSQSEFGGAVVHSVQPEPHIQQPFFYAYSAESFIESNLPCPPLPLACTTIFGPNFAHKYQHPPGYPTHWFVQQPPGVPPLYPQIYWFPRSSPPNHHAEQTTTAQAAPPSTINALNPMATVFRRDESDADIGASMSPSDGLDDDSDVETVTEESYRKARSELISRNYASGATGYVGSREYSSSEDEVEEERAVGKKRGNSNNGKSDKEQNVQAENSTGDEERPLESKRNKRRTV